MQIPELDFEIPPEAQRGSLSTVCYQNSSVDSHSFISWVLMGLFSLVKFFILICSELELSPVASGSTIFCPVWSYMMMPMLDIGIVMVIKHFCYKIK